MSSSAGSLIPLFKIKVEEKGRIKDIKEIIVRIEGLPTCLNGQIVNLGDGVKGIIMGFDEEEVLALTLGDAGRLRMGSEVVGVSEPFRIPVGSGCLGRMITALGEPCDSGAEIPVEEQMPVFRDSPPITARATINDYLPIGTKIVDMLIPLARGQRQLILGDRVTGKTAIAIDAILAQRGQGMVCVYCCVGKSMSALQKVAGALQDNNAFSDTVMVVATDNSPAGEQYIVPFSAASVADFFAKRGHHVLVVFDDLTKHAWAYRQLSLLLERPPGREAYPGDIFYVQTQLMERAGMFNEKSGGGSMTFLGIAETLQNDLTGYIPSNLSSMCDGQIVLSSAFFAEGARPAIDMTTSLSIVGGRTQPPLMRHLARNLRADWAQFNEVARLSKLSSGVSDEAADIVKKGQVIQVIFQQAERAPVSVAENILLLYAVDSNRLNDLPKDRQRAFCNEIFAFAEARNESLLALLATAQELTPELEAGLKDILDEYLSQGE